MIEFRKGGGNSIGNCDDERRPIVDENELSGYPWMNRILESVISEMKVPVFYLNVTRMTDYRKDGHPSIYRQKGVKWKDGMVQDCSHWCLPGIPDSWNELLYTTLLLSNSNSH